LELLLVMKVMFKKKKSIKTFTNTIIKYLDA
jgi:hypothetical protein